MKNYEKYLEQKGLTTTTIKQYKTIIQRLPQPLTFENISLFLGTQEEPSQKKCLAAIKLFLLYKKQYAIFEKLEMKK